MFFNNISRVFEQLKRHIEMAPTRSLLRKHKEKLRVIRNEMRSIAEQQAALSVRYGKLLRKKKSSAVLVAKLEKLLKDFVNAK